VVLEHDGTSTVQRDAVALRVRGATLHVTRGPDAGRSAPVDQPTFIIGSGSSADLRLTDPGISREHVRLTLTETGVRLRDTSKNGTYLGGFRIYDLLTRDDTAIVIGETTLAITIAADRIDLPMSTETRFGAAIGQSAVMRHLFATLERAAASDLTILIEGETGVGKDLLARAIHEKSERRRGPFVVADCSAISENLIESELFGHARGAFTGADKDRRGVFEEANGGTLFLDEVGELPLELQPKLLRALEQREIRPVGGRVARPVDIRVIAATNRRLAEGARNGEFRSDLFYRLAVVKATVPPLRDRPEDILPIARSLLQKLKRDPTAEISVDIASMLEAYSWPGNVRELRNVVERYAALGDGTGLIEHATPIRLATDDELAMLPYHEARRVVVDRFEEGYAPRLLARADGNIRRAAALADIARPSLYRMLERVGLIKR
jgi:transcriptional regulator with PAS, ATPase and Fis domain